MSGAASTKMEGDSSSSGQASGASSKKPEAAKLDPRSIAPIDEDDEFEEFENDNFEVKPVTAAEEAALWQDDWEDDDVDDDFVGQLRAQLEQQGVKVEPGAAASGSGR